MKKLGTYLAVFFAGIISGFLLLTRIKKPQRIIHTENYNEDQEQTIGKIKQKGRGNNQKVEQELDQPTKAELRKTKKETRKTKRMSRKAKLST